MAPGWQSLHQKGSVSHYFGDHLPAPRILFVCPDLALGPAAVSPPWAYFREAGCIVEFATEHGDVARGDSRMLERSWFRKTVGATREDVERYYEMAGSDEFLHPHAWSSPNFSLEQFDAVFLTSGFDQRIRQYIESPSLHRLMASYFPLTKRAHLVHVDEKKLRRKTVDLPPIELPRTISEKQLDSIMHLNAPRRVISAMGKGVLALTMSLVIDNLNETEMKIVGDEMTAKSQQMAKEEASKEVDKKKSDGLKRTSTTGMGFLNRMTSKSTKPRPLQRTASTSVMLHQPREDPSTISQAKDKIINPQEPGSLCPGRSVIYNVETTSLPIWMEQVGSTVSGAYGFKNMFKTYSMPTQDQVIRSLASPSLFHAGPHSTKPYTHVAPTHHYVSGRFPGDLEQLCNQVIEEITLARKEWADRNAKIRSDSIDED